MAFFGGICLYRGLFLSLMLLGNLLDSQFGILHWPSTSSRCCNSFSSNFGVEQMVCALCVNVLITPYLAAKV